MLEKNRRAIKNGQSRDTDNIWYTKQSSTTKTKQNKTKNKSKKPQKTTKKKQTIKQTKKQKQKTKKSKKTKTKQIKTKHNTENYKYEQHRPWIQVLSYIG